MGCWEKVQELLQQSKQLRTVVGLGLAGLAGAYGIWIWHPFGSTTEVKRWASVGKIDEFDFFKSYTKETADGPSVAFVRASDQGPPSERDWSKPQVSVYSVPSIQPPRLRSTLKELTERAQVRTIDAIERASSSRPWDNLKTALSDTDEPAEKDPFLFERVLVATVAKGTAWAAGDRMVWTRIFVRPLNFKFAAYTIAKTENETVKVSSVEATDTRKLSADVALTIPGLKGSKIGLTPSDESSVKTTSEISTQYERLGVDIMPHFLRVVRESGAGGDVLGNTEIALSITTDPDSITAQAKHHVGQPDTALVVTEIAETADGKDLVAKVLPMAQLPHCALWAEVWSIYEARHVNSGNEYYDESQQNVKFVHDVNMKRTVEIVGADDVSPYVWQIQFVPKGQQPTTTWDRGRTSLQANLGGGSPRTLIFSDYGRAANLAHWVRTHPGRVLSQYQTNYGEAEARKGMGLSVVKHTQDDCADSGTQPADVMAAK